jgi:hypothetical protein
MDRLKYSETGETVDVDRYTTIYITHTNSDVRSASVNICAYRVIHIT